MDKELLAGIAFVFVVMLVYSLVGMLAWGITGAVIGAALHIVGVISQGTAQTITLGWGVVGSFYGGLKGISILTGES